MLRIQSELIGSTREFLSSKGFTEILPVVLSSETDPLCHDVFDAKIPYYDAEYHLTKSMILHKQIALSYLDKIFTFSPNIRLETADKRDTGRHLIEFTQLDLEVKDASRDEIIALGEELISYLISRIIKKCESDLKILGRELRIPKIPFKRIAYTEAIEKFGEDFELKLSKIAKDPIWLIDIPIERREFYDKEDPDRLGILLDMDLIYPEGYGEGLSGGEREFKHEKIIERIKKSRQKLEDYKTYLDLAERGIFPSAGFGIGIERLTRFICSLESVEMARLFPKVPGGKSSL